MGPHAGFLDDERDGDGTDDRRDGAEHEDERDPAERPGSEGPDRRADEQAAHLRRGVQAERLAPALWRGGIGQVAARGRVVHRGRDPGQAAQDDERERPDQEQRQDLEEGRQEEAQHHQRDACRPVREPAEDRLEDEPGDRPGRDDDAEGREVDPLLVEIERQDRQQTTEAEPDDEFGGEQWQDRGPPIEPGGDAGEGRVGGHGISQRRMEVKGSGVVSPARAGCVAQDDPGRIIAWSCLPPGCSPSGLRSPSSC